MGPLEFLVLEFPGESPRAESAGVLAGLGRDGQVALVDSLVVAKAAAGSLGVWEVADLPQFADVLGGGWARLIGAEDAEEVARTLEPGWFALIALVEHVWARDLGDRAGALGGRLSASVRIDPGVAEQVAALAAIGK
jgi:hypothetical protein